MKKCDDCGQVFDEFKTVTELVIAEPYYPSVYFSEEVCPNCGHDSWTTVNYCKCCESEFTEDVYCEECLTAANYHISRMITAISLDTLGEREEVLEMVKELIKEKE